VQGQGQPKNQHGRDPEQWPGELGPCIVFVFKHGDIQVPDTIILPMAGAGRPRWETIAALPFGHVRIMMESTDQNARRVVAVVEGRAANVPAARAWTF